MTEAGPKQHFLPAGFIGRFSEATTGAARKRHVWVQRRNGDRPRRVAARRVGFALDLYTLTGPDEPDRTLVDDMWSPVEAALPDALDELVGRRNGRMDAHRWAQTLVPFFTSLFVRGPEFTERFERRLRDVLGDEPYDEIVGNPDNTNFARLFELQRLYAVVMAAEWRVVHFDQDVPLITSDVGYTLTQDAGDDRVGYAIPVDRHTAVTLFAGRARTRLWWRDDAWFAGPIAHADMPADAAKDLNGVSAASAIAEIYGPSRESVEAAGASIGSDDQAVAIGPLHLIGDEASLRDTEMAWFEMADRLSRPPDPAFLAGEGDFVGAARVAEQRGDPDRAAGFLERNIDAATRDLGPHHAVVRAAGRDLAELRRRQGNLDAVVVLQEEILRSAIEAEGARSRAALEARVNLGITLRTTGRLEEARRYQSAALDVAVEEFGERDPGTAHAAWGLFLTLYELGDEAGRALAPRFLWVRDADPADLGPSELALQQELIRLFGEPERDITC